MKLVLFFFLIVFSSASYSGGYFGGSYGYGSYSSDALDKYKVAPKGPTYGGFVGYGKDFVGLEFFYQLLTSEGKVKHDGSSYTIKENAAAMGAALRFSYDLFYFRFGLAQYTLDQSIDASDPLVSRTADAVYKIEEKNSKQKGVILGLGLQTKLGPGRVFIDYTRYQVYSIGKYDTVSVGMTFTIPERWFGSGGI